MIEYIFIRYYCPGLCTCISTAISNKVKLNNNLCRNCGKHFRLSDSFNNNSADSDEHFYENTKKISPESPIYTNTFVGDQTFSNYDEFKNNCCCEIPQGNAYFCSLCGGLNTFEPNIEPTSTLFSHEDKYIFWLNSTKTFIV